MSARSTQKSLWENLPKVYWEVSPAKCLVSIHVELKPTLHGPLWETVVFEFPCHLTKGVCKAGLKKGLLDDRSGLLAEIFRIIDECPTSLNLATNFLDVSVNFFMFSVKTKADVSESLVVCSVEEDLRALAVGSSQ